MSRIIQLYMLAKVRDLTEDSNEHTSAFATNFFSSFPFVLQNSTEQHNTDEIMPLAETVVSFRVQSQTNTAWRE